MAPRANWKGYLKLAELSCAVSLFTAASTSERIAFHTLNRKTGNRVHRQFVDSETGKPVEADEQVKGYETGNGDYVVLEPEEIAAAIPDADKTLAIQEFVAVNEVDDSYFDRPYYLAPSTPDGREAFALIREGMRKRQVAAIARTVLFRRMRSLLIRPAKGGLIATTLNFDYEIRSADEAFADIPKIKVEGEMLDLARHIIGTKKGKFDPAKFDDRYEAALADLVKAKIEGRKIAAPPRLQPTKPHDLLEALRQSAGGGGPPTAPKRKATAPAGKSAPRRKAG